MPEILAKIGQAFLGGVKGIAAGKSQQQLGLQSPHLPAGLTRIGRFTYSAFGGWVIFSWYTAYVNQRVELSDSWATKFVAPGSLSKPVISPPDRPDKSVSSVFSNMGNSSSTGPLGPVGEAAEELLEDGAKQLGISQVGKVPSKGRTLVRITSAQLGVPGNGLEGYLWTAPDGQKQLPPYNATRYRGLNVVAQKLATQYGLKISSGYRPGSTGSGGSPDLHSVGLAFDLVGSSSNERRLATWASKNPGLFQEIFIHNEGSGIHLHLGFYPDAAQILNSKAATYARAVRQVPRLS